MIDVMDWRGLFGSAVLRNSEAELVRWKESVDFSGTRPGGGDSREGRVCANGESGVRQEERGTAKLK